MKKQLTVISFLLLALIVLFLFLWLPSPASVYRFFRPYLDTEVSGPVTLSSDWMEIVPKEPLKAERQAQYLMFELQETPDDSTVKPQVRLIDQEGNFYDLTSHMLAQTGTKRWAIGVGAIDSLPKNKVYRAVRIRVDKPLTVSRIYWRCFNQWDVG